MQYSSRAGEHILDQFGGSGSNLIAAEQLGRRAFLMELDPLHCDLIVTRYEQFTGKKVKRPRSPGGAGLAATFATCPADALAVILPASFLAAVVFVLFFAHMVVLPF